MHKVCNWNLKTVGTAVWEQLAWGQEQLPSGKLRHHVGSPEETRPQGAKLMQKMSGRNRGGVANMDLLSDPCPGPINMKSQQNVWPLICCQSVKPVVAQVVKRLSHGCNKWIHYIPVWQAIRRSEGVEIFLQLIEILPSLQSQSAEVERGFSMCKLIHSFRNGLAPQTVPILIRIKLHSTSVAEFDLEEAFQLCRRTGSRTKRPSIESYVPKKWKHKEEPDCEILSIGILIRIYLMERIVQHECFID